MAAAGGQQGYPLAGGMLQQQQLGVMPGVHTGPASTGGWWGARATGAEVPLSNQGRRGSPLLRACTCVLLAGAGWQQQQQQQLMQGWVPGVGQQAWG
jgi:hypothetical protein